MNYDGLLFPGLVLSALFIFAALFGGRPMLLGAIVGLAMFSSIALALLAKLKSAILNHEPFWQNHFVSITASIFLVAGIIVSTKNHNEEFDGVVKVGLWRKILSRGCLLGGLVLIGIAFFKS